MRRALRLIVGIAIVLVAGFVVYAWVVDGRGARDRGSGAGPLHVSGTPIEQGRYLAAAADCRGCHSAPGTADFAGGVAFQLPVGDVYSSNLTPDPETGIGGWTDEEFLRAVRGGVGRGGRHLYPAHPYTSYAAMARDDVLAIKAYLASLPAVHNAVPASELRFPFSQRWLMPLWNALNLNGRRFAPDPGHDADWNRGKYLATALGHCGECHTPRNLLYGLRGGRELTGAVTQGWKAYDITSSAHSGIGAWSLAALSEYLATGHSAGHGAAAGPMKEVVYLSTSRLSSDDRAALVSFLLAGAPATAEHRPDSVHARVEAGSSGAALYAGACTGCHPLSPAAGYTYYSDLHGARDVLDPAGTNLLRILSDGSPAGPDGYAAMPAFGRGYSDAERAALANFVLARWGHLAPSLTPSDAARSRLMTVPGG